MELKKNPEVEVGRFGTLYFQVGLCLLMFVTYISLEYKSYEPIIKPPEMISFDESYEANFEKEIPVMQIKTPVTSAAPVALGKEGIKIVDDLAKIEETFMESTETSQSEVVGKVSENHTPILKINDVKVKDVEEDIEIPFAVIENAPIFPGCEKGTKDEIKACFQKKIQQHIADNFEYPELARDRGLYGKVFVLFAIDKNGQVANVQTRGPDRILEKEAERIICLLPTMTPGKQRGKPTRVTYSIPINFKYVEY